MGGGTSKGAAGSSMIAEGAILSLMREQSIFCVRIAAPAIAFRFTGAFGGSPTTDPSLPYVFGRQLLRTPNCRGVKHRLSNL
jgi:hypothetical protein